MRRDPVPHEGDEDPLDAALGELHDLAELERRFAVLDEQISRTPAPRASDDEDPFSDIARALREHRAAIEPTDAEADEDADEDSLVALEAGGAPDADGGDQDEDEDEDDPVTAAIEEQCQDALDALDADEVALARELAMDAVRLDDEHPFPMFVLGLIAERDGDLDTARDMAELSLRTATTNADAIGLRAHIHVRQHELREAEELLRFGIAHNPDDATLHEGLARVALARGDHAAAASAAGAALRLEPLNHGALAVRTAALDAGHDRGALLAALRQGVQLHPEDPYALMELASVEMEHGNLDRARVLLLRAQRLAPRDADIVDVRALVEHVHDLRLLRAVPTLLRWLRDFPGGLAGFVLGFVIAALPLHALAVAQPQYRVAAFGVIAVWGTVALYAWIAPSVLSRRLNARAACDAARRIEAELEDPLASPPPLERVADVVSMLALANRRRTASRLLDDMATRIRTLDPERLEPGQARLATPFAVLARRLRGASARSGALARFVPGLGRTLVALAALTAVAAPLLAERVGAPSMVWYAGAAFAVLLAWIPTLAERAVDRLVDDAFTAMRIVLAEPVDVS